MKIETVNRALAQVHGELWDVGLLTDRLREIEVLVETIDIIAYEACFIVDDSILGSLLGYRKNHIYIPIFQWLDFWPWREKRSGIRDLLRHEFGHAIAAVHPRLARLSAEFRQVFGGRYDDETGQHEYDPERHVSSYSAKNPSEDFAEIFCLFLKKKGKIESYRQRDIVFKKLKFCQGLSQKVA